MCRSLWDFGKSLFCSPLLRKDWCVCCACMWAIPLSLHQKGRFFIIYSYPKMPPLVFEQALSCSVSGEVLQGSRHRHKENVLDQERSHSSQSSNATAGIDFTGGTVTPALHLSMVFLPASQHFSVILGCGGHFNFPFMTGLLSLISLDFINWRLALAGIAVICSLKERDRFMQLIYVKPEICRTR